VNHATKKPKPILAWAHVHHESGEIDAISISGRLLDLPWYRKVRVEIRPLSAAQARARRKRKAK